MVNWLVPVDGSHHGSYAFNLATSLMDKKSDTLFVLMVGENVNYVNYGFAAPYIPADIIEKQQQQEEARCKRLILPYCRKAKQIGVANVKALYGTSSHVGELICNTVKERDIHFVVMGRRGMGTIKRLFVGSNSKYVVEHADCNVLVVKSEVGPEEEHLVSRQTVHNLEEEERVRRIAEAKDEDAQEEARRQAESKLNKEKTIALEEEERKRRISEAGGQDKQAAEHLLEVVEKELHEHFAFESVFLSEEELKKR